jgi:poly(3-hydroxybutyrate) depolymerase
MYGLESIADKEKFIVVYPDGIFKVSGSNGWDISGSSDVDFISAIIDSMSHYYNTDPDQIFATGFSMGGMMSYKLACTITDKLAAIAPASGYPMSKFGYNGICMPFGPIPICHFHGTADDVVTYSGLEAFVDNFVKSNYCTAASETTNPSSKIKKEHWKLCDGGSEIVIYHFNGMGHAYPTAASQGFSPNDTLWEFFRKHPRNSTVQIQGKQLLTWNGKMETITPAFPIHCSAGIFIVYAIGEYGTLVVKIPVHGTD